MTTTIQINEDIRDILNDMKMHPRETYNDVIERILEYFQDLNAHTKKEIKKAMEEIDSGMYKSLDQIIKELGL
jgi:hemerythrin-like domain-containing protein